MNWSVIGLILDIIGVILLFVSAEMLNKIIEKLLRAAASSSKVGGTGLFSGSAAMMYFEEEGIAPKKRRANLFSKMGLVLIILGFIFQLIGSLR